MCPTIRCGCTRCRCRRGRPSSRWCRWSCRPCTRPSCPSRVSERTRIASTAAAAILRHTRLCDGSISGPHRLMGTSVLRLPAISRCLQPRPKLPRHPSAQDLPGHQAPRSPPAPTAAQDLQHRPLRRPGQQGRQAHRPPPTAISHYLSPIKFTTGHRSELVRSVRTSGRRGSCLHITIFGLACGAHGSHAACVRRCTAGFCNRVRARRSA